jgi:hypothetical protein
VREVFLFFPSLFFCTYFVRGVMRWEVREVPFHFFTFFQFFLVDLPYKGCRAAGRTGAGGSPVNSAPVFLFFIIIHSFTSFTYSRGAGVSPGNSAPVLAHPFFFCTLLYLICYTLLYVLY